VSPPDLRYAAVKSRTSSLYWSPGLLLFDEDVIGLEMIFEELFELSTNEQPSADVTRTRRPNVQTVRRKRVKSFPIHPS
jgi:hypothetical protein